MTRRNCTEIMADYRTIFFLIGMLLSALAGGMLVPAFTEILLDQPDWPVFITAALITGVIAGALVLTNRGKLPPLSVRQAFLLTSGAWLALTAFAALPFAFSGLGMRFSRPCPA